MTHKSYTIDTRLDALETLGFPTWPESDQTQSVSTARLIADAREIVKRHFS